MGSPEEETSERLVPYEFVEQAQEFIDTLREQVPILEENHKLETIDIWDESDVRTTGQGKKAAFLRGLQLYEDAQVVQSKSDHEDRQSTTRKIVGVACYGKIERTIEDALGVIEEMAGACRGNPFGQDVWDDFDHGNMVGIRFFVFNG